MIQQVLDRRFLEDFLAGMESESASSLRSTRRRAIRKTPLDDFSEKQVRELLTDIRQARKDLSVPSTAVSQRRGSVRSGAKDLPTQDRKAYIPHSAVLSNLQSAIEEYFRTERPETIEGQSGAGRRGALPLQAGERISIWPDYAEGRRLFGRFEQTDIRWVSAKLAQGMRYFRGKHPFVPLPARTSPIKLHPNTRIIVVGDWGSGIPRAQRISELMRRELDAGIKERRPQHVIHLGDVYYAGWKFEYVERFLKYWPVKLHEKDEIGSFTLNGNHDMYSGGHHYYGVALADPRFKAWQGQSSLFLLSNSDWQFFGIDTAHENAGLEGNQANWINRTAVAHPKKGKVKVVLLSHHQYCSSYEKPSSTLINKIQRVLTNRDVNLRAWLWGHEHRCLTYKGVPALPFASCIGHGGVPVYQIHRVQAKVPKPGDFEYRDVLHGGIGGLEPWAKFGFAVLDFNGDQISVRYVGEDGRPVHRETIQ
jgi:hypothetical protein